MSPPLRATLLMLLALACTAAACGAVRPATSPPTYGYPKSGGSA